MTDDKKTKDDMDWSLTGWEGARHEQLRRWSQLSLEQIIAAQEEMAELSRQLSDTPERRTPKK